MTSSIEVDSKNKKMILKMNKSFYPESNILNTMKKFSDICLINMSEGHDGYILLSFESKSDEVDIEEIGYEFFNHLLASIKEDIGGL